ncbi:hypothetical protein HN51_041863 [Arachis hypogaea]|uniref:Auxin-induced protein n=2 Tax=Arachis hypogaea TaxID=3818 RepID=A0A444YUE5_ARAHY|nr:auxin-responsive protein SAUR72-like [Arachis ipaensis]XP_025657502.1 auxin-responsive protein SAUR72 [Arachis hypogaea]QHN87701.1 Auxin-responsive protein [Arachis hypogaea]RYR05550.1 hypothetical protein Ahy_B06g085410 isoform E [Arachis hypogaea]
MQPQITLHYFQNQKQIHQKPTMSIDPRKSNKIREIVRLQQILKKWRRIASNNNNNNNNHDDHRSTAANTGTTTSKSIKFLKRTLSLSERDVAQTANNNTVVPKGYLAICVGEELKRFVIPTVYLGHQAFQILLREAEEEFGFQQTGVLRIPCEVSVFESILKMVEGKNNGRNNNQKEKVSTTTANQECKLSAEEIMSCCSSSSDNQLAYSHHPQSPLCR